MRKLSLGNMNQRFFSGLLGNKFKNGFYLKAFGLTNQADGYREHHEPKNNSLFAEAGIDYARGTLRLNAQVANNHVLFPGQLTYEQFIANPRQATDMKNLSHYQTQVFQLLSKHELNSEWILETRAAHNVILGDGIISSVFNRKEWQDSIHPRLLTSLGGAKSVLGYFGQRNEFHFTNAITQQKATAVENDVYVQTIIPFSSLFDITLGARSAWQNNSAERIIGLRNQSLNRVFVSEQGISYHPNQQWQFFLRRDGNFRFPKANEMTWMKPGEALLQPQTGVSYETGFVRATEKQKTQLNIYQLDLHNEIAFDTTQSLLQPMGRYSNFSLTRRRGVTLAETYSLTSQLKLDTQLNYVTARFVSGRFSGNKIPMVPAFNGNIAIAYHFAEFWRARVSALYTGERYASLDLTNQARRLPGYWLNTLSLQYVRQAYELGFEMNNVFNVQYPAFAVYNAVTRTSAYPPGSGRSYLLTLKANID